MFFPARSRVGHFAVVLACAVPVWSVVACESTEPSSDGTAPDAGTPGRTAGRATVAGTVTGKSLAPVEAFARKSNLYNQGDISIYVASRGGICDVSKISPEGLADTTFLEIDLPRGWPPPPGAYPIVSSIGTLEDGGITMGAFAYLKRTDTTCKYVGTDDEAKALNGGSVTIEAPSDSLVTGRFDLQFQKGELHGTFSVPLCDIAFPSGSTKTCQH